MLPGEPGFRWGDQPCAILADDERITYPRHPTSGKVHDCAIQPAEQVMALVLKNMPARDRDESDRDESDHKQVLSPARCLSQS
jgi:hypothetical protein